MQGEVMTALEMVSIISDVRNLWIELQNDYLLIELSPEVKAKIADILRNSRYFRILLAEGHLLRRKRLLYNCQAPMYQECGDRYRHFIHSLRGVRFRLETIGKQLFSSRSCG